MEADATSLRFPTVNVLFFRFASVLLSVLRSSNPLFCARCRGFRLFLRDTDPIDSPTPLQRTCRSCRSRVPCLLTESPADNDDIASG